MDELEKTLQNRLKQLTKQPNFLNLFKKNFTTKPHIIKKGTLIFNEGDPLGRLYFIQKGFVKLYRLSQDGRETTIYLLGPGYMLGVRALLSLDECARHSAEALTDLTVFTISRKDYFTFLAKHPEYTIDLIHVFLDRLTYTERKLEGFIVSSTTARVANFLLDAAKRFGKSENNKQFSVILPMKLTHQRIAEFVGAFRETVTIALHTLEQKNIITTEKGKITIHNMKKLQQYANLGKRN